MSNQYGNKEEKGDDIVSINDSYIIKNDNNTNDAYKTNYQHKNNYYTSKQHNLEDKQTYTNFRVVTK